MALPVDQNAPDTAPEAATDLLGADGVGAIVSQAGASQAGATPAGIVVAAAGDGLQADLTLLGLDDLLDLPIVENGSAPWQDSDANDSGTVSQASQPTGLAQLLATADLPADLTALDLDQVLGLQLAGASLPTVLEVAELPADLTALELAQVLGLELVGDTLPTSRRSSSLRFRASTTATTRRTVPIRTAPTTPMWISRSQVRRPTMAWIFRSSTISP